MTASRHVVIVGRDVALWLSAAAIRHALAPAGVEVTAVELPTRLGSASVHATHPAIEALHAKLGIDEAALLRSTGGCFSLGWNIRRGGGEPFFLAHGAYGAPIDGGDFFPYWAKARQFGLDAELEDFSPTAQAARHGRILFPDEETERFGRTDYAYHLPAIAYAAMLKNHALRLGVVAHQVSAVTVERDSGSGHVRAILRDVGSAIAGDLFVDASGTEAILIGRELAVAAEDWRQYFPLDHRLRGVARPLDPVPSYAELRLSGESWTALHSTPAATHVVHAYRDGDEAGLAEASAAAGLALQDATADVVSPALRSSAWSGNCVAIGESACAFDPLFDVDLHAIQLGLVHLLSLFPTSAGAEAERAEYNRVTRSLFERLRDFQAALYLLSGISANAPDSLRLKLDAFSARGAIAPMEDETFTADQWRALFVGLGLMPESWPPAIDTTAPEIMKQGFRRILGFVRDKVLEQPAHDACLAEIAAGQRQ